MSKIVSSSNMLTSWKRICDLTASGVITPGMLTLKMEDVSSSWLSLSAFSSACGSSSACCSACRISAAPDTAAMPRRRSRERETYVRAERRARKSWSRRSHAYDSGSIEKLEVEGFYEKCRYLGLTKNI